MLLVLVEADAHVKGMGEVGLRTVCAHSAWGAERVLAEQAELFVQVQWVDSPNFPLTHKVSVLNLQWAAALPSNCITCPVSCLPCCYLLFI